MNTLHKNQSGLVSIVVSMLLILVLSLIVMAFARLTQREQRQVLDRQLSTEAFYAAESGINDGTRALLTNGSNERTEENDDCDPPDGYSNQLEGNNIIYSCLLIDPTPTSIEFGNIDQNDEKIFPLDLKDGSSPESSVSIFWQTPSSTLDNSGCPGGALNSFTPTWPTAPNCSSGVLRIEIVPIPKSGAFSRNDMIANTAVIFAVPANSPVTGSVNLPLDATGFGKQGRIVGSGCLAAASRPKHCRIDITGISLTGNPVVGNVYWVRVTPLYRSAALTVCTNACNPTASEWKGAQAQVDSTGRASDVLRRIQVRVGISEVRGNPTPQNAIEATEGVCKRVIIAPPTTASDECDIP